MTEPVVIEFIASANFTDLQAQVAAAQGQIASFQKTLASPNVGAGITQAVAAYKQAMSAGGQYLATNLELTTSTDKFTASLARGKLTMAQARAEMVAYRNEVSRATSNVARLGTQQELLSRSVLLTGGRTASGGLSAVMATPTGMEKDALAGLVKRRAEMTAMAKLQDIYNQKLIDMGKNAQWSGRQMMIGLTLPITMFGAAAAKAFYTVDQELTKMVKVYGDINTQLGPQQVEELRSNVLNLAKELAAAWGATAQTTLGMASDMAAIGKTGADLITSTREAVRLSVLGGVDQAASMKTILSVQSAFKVSTDDLANSINFLNAVENQTSATLEDFTNALPIAGPAVHALGGDIKELALMLVSMREGGVGATEAANALKTSLGRLINPSKAATDLLKKFNIDLIKIVDKTQGDPVKTIEAMQEAMKGLTRLQKDQVMAAVFGLRQYSRMTALFDNINKAGGQAAQVKKLSGASNADLASVAQQEINRVAESASGRFQRAMESMKLSLVPVGETFLNIGTGILNVFTKIADLFAKMPDPFKNALIGAGIFVAVVGPLKMLWGIMANMIGSIRSMFFSAKNKFTGIDPNKPFSDTMSEAEKLAGERVDQSMYDHAEATKVWEKALKELTAQLLETKKSMELMVSANGVGPASLSASGRSQIAELMMARAGGHTVIPETVEQVLFGGRLSGPTRVIPQSNEANAAQSNKMGSFYGVPGMAQIDKRAFALGSAQAAQFEMLLANMGSDAPKIEAEIKPLIAKIRAAKGKFSADLIQELTDFWQKYQMFFDTLESQTQQTADLVEAKIAEIATLSDEQAMARLKTALNELGVSFAQFDKAIEGKAYDVRSIVAQLETHSLLGGGRTITSRTGSGIYDPYSRAGQLTGGMAAAGLPVTYATLDMGAKTASETIVRAATQAATIQETSATKVAQERLAQAEAELKMRTEAVLSAKTSMEKFLTRGMEQDARNHVAAAKVQLAAAEQASTTVVKSAAVAARETIDAGKIAGVELIKGAGVAAQEMSSGGIRSKMGSLLGRGGVGKVSGGLMAASMIGMMIPDTGNATIDNSKSILSGVGMGAGAGMMLGPEGAAVGAVVGGLITAIPMLVSKLNEAGDAMKASFSVGETAASAFGAKLKTITDVQMNDLITQTKVAKDSYDKFLEGFKSAAADSEDRKFIDSLVGGTPEEIATKIKNRIAAGFAAGMSADDLRAEVAAALAASNNSGQLGLMDLIVGKSGKLDTTKLMQDQISSVQKAIAEAKANAGPMPAPLGISMAAGQPGSPEWQKEVQAQKDQIANWNLMIAKSDEVQSALKPLADNFMSLAISMEAPKFDDFIKKEGLAGISAQTFNEYIKNIPGVSSDVANAMDALASHGATTAQMLEAINLKTHGVIQSWGELITMPPAQLDIIFTINQQKIGVTQNEVAPLLEQARAQLRNIQVKSILDPKAIQKASKAKQDAWNAEKKAVTDRYNKEIDALKKVEAARQAAADAEAKRLQREKQMADFAISYREAIASGDMAKAAQIQNNRASAQAEWAQQDSADAAKSKAQAKIDALTAERDAKIAAIEKAAEAEQKATQNTLDNIDAINKARAAQNAKEISDAQAKVDTLIRLQKEPWSPAVQSEIAAAAGLTGSEASKAMHDAFIKTVGPMGQEIWKNVQGDLMNAPWNLIADYAQSIIAGDPKDIKDARAAIDNFKFVKVAYNGVYSKHSRGGPVIGQGTATSDSINARLSNGEFVVRASAVNKYGASLLHAINSGNFASGGLVQALGSAYAQKAFSASATAATKGLYATGVDAGRLGAPGGGSAKVVGSGLGAMMAQWAEQFVGVPYSRTAADPTHGWGCATFVDFIYRHFGIRLPSSSVSNDQFNGLRTSVPTNKISAGDLLFYHYANGVNVKNRVNHVGLALSPTSQIEAANPKAGTRISGIDWGHFVGAKRVISPDGIPLMAQGGEFMMRRDAVNTYGPAMMNAINNQTYHTGGLVTAGGPKIDKFASGGHSEYNFNIYATPGMDCEEVANLVIDKLGVVERRKGLKR